MARIEIVDFLRQRVNWGPSTPVFASNHNNKSGTAWRGYAPGIVVIVPRVDTTRSTKVLEVVSA
jgi:hypothetical protein